MTWEGLRIAIIAGDEREQEIARLAAATGAQVTASGFPWPPNGVDGVIWHDAPMDALRGAHYALFPIPGMAADGSLFAPAADEPIVPDPALLGVLAPDAHVILGTADDRLRRAAAATGTTLLEYEQDRELMLLRTPAIIEGALRIAVEQTDVTIHAAPVAVVGFGNVGSLLAATLRALGADVTVAARNRVQRAGAYAIGATSVTLDELVGLAPELVMLFSTVPAQIVDRALLRRLPPGSLVMDLAAPPGGVDLGVARELGHRAVWARGLGRRAPVTVGASQWAGIRRRIEAIEEGQEP